MARKRLTQAEIRRMAIIREKSKRDEIQMRSLGCFVPMMKPMENLKEKSVSAHVSWNMTKQR